MSNRKSDGTDLFTRVGMLLNPLLLNKSVDETITLVEESVLYSLVQFRHLYLVSTEEDLERIKNTPELQEEKMNLIEKEHRAQCVAHADRNYGGVLPVAPQYQRDTGLVAFGLKAPANTLMESFQLLHAFSESVSEANIVFAFFFQDEFEPLRPGGTWEDMKWDQWGILKEDAFTRCILEVTRRVIAGYGSLSHQGYSHFIGNYEKWLPSETLNNLKASGGLAN